MKLKSKVITFVISLILLYLAFSLGLTSCENTCNEEMGEVERTVFTMDEKRSRDLFYETEDCRREPFFKNEGCSFKLVSADSERLYIVEAYGGGYTVRHGSDELSGSSLSSLMESIERDGAVIEFVNVKTDENLNITKNVTLSGVLEVNNAALNISGEAVRLQSFDFSGSCSSVKIKDGVTEGVSGSISTQGAPAVILDFSSSAKFVACGIKVNSGSVKGAICSDLGSVIVKSGEIKNEFGPAIENSATLCVVGNPEISGLNFDVVTDKPIALSLGEERCSSSLRVMYKDSFEKGSFSVVFRGADKDTKEKISLFDIEGEELHTEFFESSKYTEEQNVLAVYLPYVLKFYNGSSIYKTAHFLKDEKIQAPENPTREGYSFSGWYADTGFSEGYTFGNSESRDFSLYAGFSLNAPEFSLSSLEFEYDAKRRVLGFDYLYHPLSDDGQFSFVWYKNFETVSNSSSSLDIMNVSDSGSYFCKLTFSYRGDFISVNTPSVEVLVHKKTVKKPTVPPQEYTGLAQSPTLEESLDFLYIPPSATEVGSYSFELRLTDFENMRWADSFTDTTLVNFEITPAKNAFLSAPRADTVYESEAPRVSYKLKFGTGIVEFSADGVIYSTDAPTTAGKYYLRVRADATTNYDGVISEAVEFTVLREVCTGIKIDTLPTKTAYRAFEKIDLSGAVLSASYNSGRSEKIDISELVIEYGSGDYLLVTDSSVSAVYKGNSVPIPVSVSAAEYDLSALSFSDAEVVYNGLRHTLSAVCDIVGEDGLRLGFKVSGGGINAGVYTVTLSFYTDSINYVLPEPITRTLTVNPMELTALYSGTAFVYDGTPKLPNAVLTGAQGIPILLTLSGAATDAGEYTAYASLSDKNYILTNPSIAFSILKANFDLSGVIWSAESFVYNGEVCSVSLSGLPQGINLLGYANASFTDAGSYVAEAAISYDEKNYNSPGKITHKWKIERADYVLGDFSFLDSQYVFDGSVHYPRVVGSLPIGFDGSTPSYSFSEGASHVFEGKKAVTVTFATESKNYNAPPAVTVYVTITPKPIEIIWDVPDFVYNGEVHAPTVRSGECEITVSGAASDAGEYTAYAHPKNSDYKITNDSITFFILKAENEWTKPLCASSVYEGEELSVLAEAYFGEVNYKFYKSSALTEEAVLPLAVGDYYAVAIVAESKNYREMTSEAISFSVLKILPTELKIELYEPLFAMKRLSDFSYRIYYINNNGSQTELSADEFSVEYENGDGLRASDETLRISAGGFSLTLPITVLKSVVELPELASVVYNGEKRIPSALSSALYTTDFTGAKNAGEYKIRFTLTDGENYVFKNGISEMVFVIRKAPITLEVNKRGKGFSLVSGSLFGTDELSAEYYEEDGKIFLRIDNPNYELTVIPAEEKSAGVYVLLLFLLALVIVLTAIGLYIVFSLREKRTAEAEAASQNSMSGPVLLPENRLSADKSEKALDTVLAPINTQGERESQECATEEEQPLETLLAVDESYANNLISDSVAKSLIGEDDEAVETDGKRRCILNLDTISENFSAGETVNINDFKKKGLIAPDARYVKILARGVIDKPITILANSFSLSAVKMIALTGGSAKRVRTVRRKR